MVSSVLLYPGRDATDSRVWRDSPSELRETLVRHALAGAAAMALHCFSKLDSNHGIPDICIDDTRSVEHPWIYRLG